jgi:vancomycin permeability regulator SanA
VEKEITEPKSKPGFIKRYLRLWIVLGVLFLVLIWGPSIYANLSTRGERYDLAKTSLISNVPKRKVALVFGAGVYPSGKPTPYLQWRVETAVKLYKAHRVERILMSGDNSTLHYNEPVAMGKLAETLGVPAKDIILDYAGLSTYESCYRANAIFKINDAIVVSQGYHLPRAVMTCNALGIDTIGVSAQRPQRDFTPIYIMREWISTDKAALQLIFKPKPTFLGPELPVK